MNAVKSMRIPRFSLERILAMSERVVKAFGRVLGFIVIMTALLLSAGVTAGTIITVGNAIAHWVGKQPVAK